MPRPLKLDRAGKLKLSEADVVRQVTDYLEIRGWRGLKQGYGEIWRDGKPVEWVGEEGMPDRQFIRYKGGQYAEIIWAEFKRPKCKGDSGGRLRPKQSEWLMVETARGGLCVVVDSLDQFAEWYRENIGGK